MTNTKNQKKKEQIKVILSKHGFKEDRYGNWKNGKGIRFKFQKTSLRKEGKMSYGWATIYVAYYKYITIEDGKMKIEKTI